MSKKYINRALTWSLLVIALIFVTIYMHRIFITNGVLKEIEEEKINAQSYDGNIGKIAMMQNRLNNYNSRIYDDNKFAQMIPDGYNDNEIIINYVNRPVLLSGANLLDVKLAQEMPAGIEWTNKSSIKDIKAVKVTVNFEIDDIDALEDYIAQLESSIRLIYFGDIKFNLPGENSPENMTLKVQMNYYLFYKEIKTT